MAVRGGGGGGIGSDSGDGGVDVDGVGSSCLMMAGPARSSSDGRRIDALNLIGKSAADWATKMFNE